MKTITVILLSMVILSGCENPFNFEGLKRFGGLGTKDTKGDFWEKVEKGTRRVYTAKVVVTMENGDPCTEAFIENPRDNSSPLYYTNEFGEIYMKETGCQNKDKIPDSINKPCFIRLNQDEPPIGIFVDIILYRGDSYPTFSVVFPDSLARSVP